MRIRIALIISSFVIFSLGVPAYAQSKIESALPGHFKTNALARVLIVTRPDPQESAGGASLSNPSGYVSTALGGNASHVKAIGGMPVVSAEISQAALALLREDPNVVLVTTDVPMPPTLMDSVQLIGGDKLHQLGFRGSNRAVAVLDTGVQFDHPGLAGAISSEACFSTTSSTLYQVTSLCPSNLDMSSLPGAARQCPANVQGCEHGTHVAGIIAGRQMSFATKNFAGVAPAANVVAVQVFTLFQGAICGGPGQCVRSFTSDQLRALEWVFKRRDDLKIAAINMSLGSGYHDTQCDNTSALTEIIERLRAKGVPTVIAAGNDAFNDGLAEPACISSAVSVAATKKDGALDVSYSNVSTLVRIAAPGTGITSSVTGSGYAMLSGTSMAAPHVAAALALLRQEFPNDTVLQLENRLTNGAPLTVDPRTGTKLPRLELTHTSPGAGPGAAPAAAPGLGPTTAPAAAPGLTPTAQAPVNQAPAATQPSSAAPSSGSFIVKSDKSAAELQSTLNDGCADLNCNLKAIAKDTYKLDVKPKGQMDPGERANFSIDATDVHKLLKGDGSTKVFDNRLSAPLAR